MGNNWSHTEESKAKMRKPRSAEFCLKMGLTKVGNKNRLGMLHTDETKNKISIANKGRVRTSETKKLMSESHKGKTPMLGKKHSNETKEKMKLSCTHHNKGENHYLWKGGITPITKQIRYCFKYRQWRSDIFTRDDFTCVSCGKHGGYIEADHFPKSFSTIFGDNGIKTFEEALICEELWNLNNGRTLCNKCHNLTKRGRPFKAEKQNEG